MSRSSETSKGLFLGFVAYGLWGLLSLYWDLVASTGALELLAHRVVWSLPTAIVILLLMRRWSWIRPLLRQPKRLGLVALSSTVIAANWGVFILAVATGRVLEASLGYFINPLVSIAFGVLFLRERLRPAQWAAVGAGALAVAVLGVAYGRMPWLSLFLAFSFASYSLIKKHTGLDGAEGFSAEVALQFLPAAAFLVFLGTRGESSFTAEGPLHMGLVMGTGLATALPLIAFGGAAVRLPLTTLGLIQYTAPICMFLIGALVLREHMPPSRWAGFTLVWAALTVLTWDALRNAHRSRSALRRAATKAAATTAATADPVSAPAARRSAPDAAADTQ